MSKRAASQFPITFDEFGFYELGPGACLDVVLTGDQANQAAGGTNGMCYNDVCVQVDGVNRVCQQVPPTPNGLCGLDLRCSFPDTMCAMCTC
jgi:hypothetical protein